MRILLTVSFLLSLLTTISAQKSLPFEVKRLPNWGHEYLTVVNDKFIFTEKIRREWGGLVEEHDLPDFHMNVPDLKYDWRSAGYFALYTAAGSLKKLSDEYKFILTLYHNNDIRKFDVITEIDNKSTVGMSENEFYRLLNNGVEITLKRHSHNGEIETIKTNFQQTEHPEWLTNKNITDIFSQGNKEVTDSDKKRKDKLRDKGLTILSDDDFDWFDVRTFDYIIDSNDPLTDKKIINEFVEKQLNGSLSSLRRDEANPDIVIRIAKSSNESSNTTYIPPTETKVNTGSFSKPKYDWIGRFSGYETQQRYEIHRTEGYNKTTKSSEVFLEITIIDAKTLRKTPNTLPIIWQATFNKHFTDLDKSIFDTYIDVVQACISPGPTLGMQKIEIHYVGFDMDDKNIITYVNPNSMAYHIGLRQGAKIQDLTEYKIYDLEYYYDSDCYLPKLSNKKSKIKKSEVYEYLSRSKYLYCGYFHGRFGLSSFSYSPKFDITLKKDGRKTELNGVTVPVDCATFVNYFIEVEE